MSDIKTGYEDARLAAELEWEQHVSMRWYERLLLVTILVVSVVSVVYGVSLIVSVS